jgi:hypothetical protein
MRHMRSAYKILVVKLEERRHWRLGWKERIKIYLREMTCTKCGWDYLWIRSRGEFS